MVMARKPLPLAAADDERTLVDVALKEERTEIGVAVAPRHVRPAASAPKWKSAPAQPPRPTPSVPRPRASTPPPLPPSVAAGAKRAAVPPLPRAAQLPRGSVAPVHQRV